MSNSEAEAIDTKVTAYIRAFSRLVDVPPGSPNFDIEQAAVDALWQSLDVSEKAAAYQQVAPYRLRLQGKDQRS